MGFLEKLKWRDRDDKKIRENEEIFNVNIKKTELKELEKIQISK